MIALVTGVAGFIGSSLARQLLTEGWDVVGVDSMTDYYSAELKKANLTRISSPKFKFVGESLNEVDLIDLLADATAVFHLAGQPGVRGSWGANFSTYTLNNITATQRLLEACLAAPKLERFVYSSSSSVYGEAAGYPTSELDRPKPVSPYGVTKLSAEHLTSLYASNFGIPTVSLRYFTVYGPRQRPDMAFTRFTRAAYSGETVRIFGSGEQIRDFTFVDDVVEANLLAASADIVPGSVFNVAGGSSTSVNEVLGLIEDLSGRSIRAHYHDAVAGDVSRTGGDTSAFREATGWAPKISLADGLAQQLAWARGDVL